jgi:hypothetical protein
MITKQQIQDARQRISAWKARREGDVNDHIASVVWTLDERYPSGWTMKTFNRCMAWLASESGQPFDAH